MATNTETSRSGFVELGEGGNRSQNMELEDVYARGKGNSAINTNIASGKYNGSYITTPSSSEEMVSLSFKYQAL
jgi:hypothetical protein